MTKAKRILGGAIAAAGAVGIAWSAMAQPAPDWDDVSAIFNARCVGCHGGAIPRAGLDLTTYASAIAGSNNGPVLIAGDPAGSRLMQRITGQVTPQMPRGGTPLGAEQIALIEAWISGGLTE